MPCLQSGDTGTGKRESGWGFFRSSRLPSQDVCDLSQYRTQKQLCPKLLRLILSSVAVGRGNGQESMKRPHQTRNPSYRLIPFPSLLCVLEEAWEWNQTPG
jgi:hypothetical protein